MRLLATESCSPLARLLNKEDSINSILPVVQKFAQVHSAKLSAGTSDCMIWVYHECFCPYLPCNCLCSSDGLPRMKATLDKVPKPAACNTRHDRLEHDEVNNGETLQFYIQADRAIQDKSWRVRYSIAQQLCQLCEALGPELSRRAFYAPLKRADNILTSDIRDMICVGVPDIQLLLCFPAPATSI